jgi:hypothetical protein
MKRFLAIALLIVLIPVISFGVDFSIGAKIGSNMAIGFGKHWKDTIEAANEGKNGVKPGVKFGPFITIGFLKFLAIQPEFNFCMSGVKYKYTDGGTDYKRTTQLFLIEFPVFVKFRFNIKKVTINIYSGVNLAYIVGDVEVKTKNGDTTTSQYDPGAINRFQLGISGGVGVDIPIGPGFLLIETFYSFPFLRFIDKDIYPDDYKVRAHNISILAGYGFKFGGKKK